MKVNYQYLVRDSSTEVFFSSNFSQLISNRLKTLVGFDDGQHEIFFHPTGNPDCITLVCRNVDDGSPRPGTPKHGDYCFGRTSFEVYDHDPDEEGVNEDLRKLEEFMFRVKNGV